MWLTKFLIIFSYCVGSHFGQELNSSMVFKNHNDMESSRSSTNNRIVGGKLINIVQVPYQVAFYIDGYFACGGSIISRDWVLTAAHCVDEGGYFAVRVGSRFIGRYGYIRYARTVVYHSKYNAYTLDHDIALVRVDRPFKWTRRIKPILLARPTQTLPQKYLVSGWGTTNEFSNKASLALRGVIVEKVPRPRCRAMYQNIGPITKNMICAALPGIDHCRGDSGGPLASNGVQYGVVSFAVGCARRRYPGVYTDVRREYLWIRNAIKKYGGQMPRKM